MNIRQDIANILPAREIVDKVNESLERDSVLVITAPPGAGKSTLLPLTIADRYVNKKGDKTSDHKVLVLEPRRLAARQIAERMAEMIGEEVGNQVGYRVRFENKVSAKTQIEVVTEGILTRRLISDPTLEGVDVIIFDEFHERSLNTDVALALTRQVQQLLRDDLKIVIMSATIDADEICAKLEAPLIESRGRMFPVEVIHTTEESDMTLETPKVVAERVSHVVREAIRKHEGDVLVFLPGEAEIRLCEEMLGVSKFGNGAGNERPQYDVCPLYGMLSNEEQKRAIMPSREGERKIVLATSIAETSLTIEGVRIVVDSGLSRTMIYDAQSGLSHLKTVRISMDMAGQRKGRAGRVSEGVCYRMWSLATEHRMAENRTPEILEADLAPMMLDLAAWGETSVENLWWMTTPPRAQVMQAVGLLQGLKAVDESCKITEHGKQLQAMPCHPRLAQMFVADATNTGAGVNNSTTAGGNNCTTGAKALAADIAAILEEKDPLASDVNDADINTRISMLREVRGKSDQRDERARGGNARVWSRIIRTSEQYRKLCKARGDNTIPDSKLVGKMLAEAYPERIAKSLNNSNAKNGTNGKGQGCNISGDIQFQTASGIRISIPHEDEMSAHEWLAIATMNAKTGRVFLASPVDKKALLTMAHPHNVLTWDNRQGRVVAERMMRIGQLTIESTPARDVTPEAIARVICEAAKKDGVSMFDFNEEVENLQRRVATVSEWHPELEMPDLSTETILQNAEEWLPLYLNNVSANTNANLKKVDIAQALYSSLTYDQQQALDKLAPKRIQLPSGRHAKVEYRKGAELPIVRVKLQDCFGMMDTPRINNGQQPVLMELLSPGFKPVQLTQDLKSFWASTYFEVRKELRRRYPKHKWPEDPMEIVQNEG